MSLPLGTVLREMGSRVGRVNSQRANRETPKLSKLRQRDFAVKINELKKSVCLKIRNVKTTSFFTREREKERGKERGCWFLFVKEKYIWICAKICSANAFAWRVAELGGAFSRIMGIYRCG